jgi:uncharacterized protein YfaS (alpha-2-macroglobulin family)
MSINHFSRLLVFGFILLFISCNKSTIEVTNRNFSDEVDLQQNLIFTFNNDLAADSVLNIWEDNEYLKFTPSVKGKFKWTSKNELIFSPDLGFLPSTDYTAEITENIFQHGGKGLKLSKESIFNFHTPYLNLETVSIYWAKKEGNRSITEARINAQFNYRIDPAEAKKLLHVFIDGKEKSFDLNSTTVSETIQISVPEGSEKYDDQDLKLTFDPGLKCIESKYVSKEIITFEIKVPSKDRFQVITASGLYEDDNSYINVLTNQEILTDDISSLITLDPKVSFKIEKNPSGFYIKGDFKTGEAYDLKISKELKGVFGGSLSNDFQQTVTFGDQAPNISFTSKSGIYLTSKGEKNIGIRIISVPKVKVTIYKIYSNNILQFLQQSGGLNSSSYNYDDYYYDDYYYSSVDYNELGDVILEKEYNTKDLKKTNGTSLLNLNFNDINTTFKGIYVVKVASVGEQYLKAVKTVSVSDIGMIVKETENDIYVFTNSIYSANAIGSVDVNLISSNNQEVYKAVTDKDGLAKFSDIKKKAPGFKIKMVTTASGEDFNYLHFNQAQVETSQYEVGGSRNNASGYQAFIYGDREIYRPGEKIYINTVVRNEKWQPLTQVPIKLKVILPNGEEFTNKRGKLNNQGAFETSIQLPVSTVTGSYNIEVYNANDVLLNSKYISVEEFIPDRIKVMGLLNKEEYKLNEEVKAEATALNLFGPPASNRNYEMEFSLKRKYFFAKGFSDYSFSINGNESLTFDKDMKQGTTDADGKANETFSFKPEYANSGILDGKIFITVFDESGRPVHQVKSFNVLTQDVFYGVKNIDYYVSTNQSLQIPIVALNKDGKYLQNASAQIQVIKYNWQTLYQKNDYGGGRYVSQRQEQILEDKVLSVKGLNATYSFNPIQSGEYEVRVKKPGVDSYVSQFFYAYGWGSTQNTSFEVSKEGSVTIEMDKEKYQVGDEAKILFKTPFPGRMLVTIERDNLFDYFYIDTDKKSASASFSIKEEYLPNAYITATLIKPVTESAIPLTVAHGFAPFIVEKSENKLPVEIIAVKQSRSRTQQKVCIKSKAESDIEVTLAVVDEGILQLKNSASPDPYAFFFQKRALEVNAYDLYPNLLPELKMNKSSMAGDGYDLEKRVNPLTNKRVKLVAFWSGLLHTNSDGEACYTLDVPQFSGDLRLMAVAYKNASFGSASTNMKVADPVVVSTSIPRFLSPGDTMLVPVTLTNTTANNTNAVSKLTVTGPLTIIGSPDQSIAIKANTEAQVIYKVVAQTMIAEAKIKTDVTAFNEHFIELNDITIRPTTSLLKISGSDKLEANTTTKISLVNSFIPSSVEGKLMISKSPLVQFSKNLDYLLGYPYGCVEQTVSKAFPQIYFSELAKSLNRKVRSNENPNYNVQEAIRKLQTMQLNNGALSYWEGGYEESWWGTVYAAHFLTEAKKAGFEVSNSMLEKMYGYMQQKLKTKDTYSYYYYNRESIIRQRQIAPKEIFYALYILAQVGRQDLSTMNYYKSNQANLALDSRYLLASTYKMLGDNASYRTLLPSAFENESSVNSFGGSFYSYIRDMAISLNSMIETDPDNPQVGILARHLSQQLKKNIYLNTQENAFVMLAMGKLALKANQSQITAEIKEGNKKIGEFTGNDVTLTKGIAGKELEIKTKGTGTLYYFWEAEGISNEGKFKEEDNFLRVRKTFYDRNGNQLSSNSFKQNDLIVIKLSLSTTDNSTVENVVITDMLPAGFEIENPRLSETADMEWIKNISVPEHYDIRDDRINLFASATGTNKTFYYMVRAVSKGTFKMGPVSADAMYNGEYHSYNGGGTIKVVERNKE